MDADFAIVGGGVVGLSVAWGLLKHGQSVIVIDGTERTPRASRGNFGLIWVQGKGTRQPRYAAWSQQSAALWSDFAEELEDSTGRNVALEQRGGLDLHFSEDSLAEWAAKYEALKAALGGDYPYEILDARALRLEEPAIGPRVVGALLHHQDGHANPLRLLRALGEDVQRLGGRIEAGRDVSQVTQGDGLFRITCADGREIRAEKVVLAAGLGAAMLGPQLGFKTPVSPERGQILITEKLPPLIRRPSLIARQVNEGGVQIGATNEQVGMDDGVTGKGLAQLAAEAVAAYPALARAQLLRSWGALRVMTPDGLPVYQESGVMPGAFLITCHSGITLAAAHARLLGDWLLGRPDAPDLEVFGEARFAI